MSGERYTPTAEEIREACRVIQAEWSPETELSRRVVAYDPARVPEVSCGNE